MSKQPAQRRKKGNQRDTEPMPASFRPAWVLMLALLGVTLLIALAAALIDRLVLG